MFKKLSLIIVILCLIITPVNAKTPWSSKPPVGSTIDYSHPLARGIVGCWIMNEGRGTKFIDLAKGKRATSYNSLGFVSTAKGVCPNFTDTGSPYIQIDDEQPLRITSGGITIVSFFNLADYGTLVNPIQFRNIFAKRTGEDANVNYEARVGRSYLPDAGGGTNTSVHFAYRVSSTWHIYNIENTGFSLNTWYMYAVSFMYGTGNSIKMYLNTTLLSANWTLGNGNTLPNSSNEPVRIGDGNTGDTTVGGSTLFNGKIAFVYLYNRALSSSEIQSLYQDPYQFIKPPTLWSNFKAGISGAIPFFQPIINNF